MKRNSSVDAFDADGFALVPDALALADCDAAASRVPTDPSSAGTRCLLDQAWCADLATRLREHPTLSQWITARHVAVQCTYFEKSSQRNWLVPIHQDLSIPVKERVDAPGFTGWSTKEGQAFVQPPVEMLERMLAVRIHLDPCLAEDGPLRVIPGTHTRGSITPEVAVALRKRDAGVECVAARGSALVMRPLLLHASSKSTGQGRRRVLHFLFASDPLPAPLQWRHAI